MTISVTALTWLVGTATLITALAPIILVIFWIKDRVKGQLW
jgi:hypothetical protein